MPVFRVTAELARGGVPLGANVFHYSAASMATQNLDDAIDAVRALFQGVRGLYTSDTTITIGETIQTVDQDPNEFGSGQTPVEVTGNGSTTAEAANGAAIITWRTGLAGRSRRGRTYLGPFRAGVLDGDGRTLGSSVVNGIQTAIGDMRAAELSTPAITSVVWSRTLNLGTEITSGQARNYIGTQRGRLT